MIETKQFLEILKKYREGKASKEEEEFLRTYYNLFELEPNVLDTMDVGEKVKLKNRMEKHLIREINSKPYQNVVLFPWRKIAAAAAILLIIGSGLFFYNHYVNTIRHPGAGRDLAFADNDIKPGGNKAYLTLANGKKLSLTDAMNGALAKEAGVEITKTADGQIIYEVSPSSSSSLPSGLSPQRGERGLVLNTIETPKGGQYQVRLPDGSKVWLNAASKLTYPVSFNGREDRKVELIGEAYFEVAKDSARPFLVRSAGQEVKVLGTHFNINAYADEPNIKTTLLEGRVTVRNSGAGRDGVLLKPGQQAITLIGNYSIKVRNVNAEEAVAWKNGLFFFRKADIQTVMRQLSRWYDVEISYQGKLPQHRFNGSIHKNLNLKDMLDVLSNYYDVPFKVDGKKIIVGD